MPLKKKKNAHDCSPFKNWVAHECSHTCRHHIFHRHHRPHIHLHRHRRHCPLYDFRCKCQGNVLQSLKLIPGDFTEKKKNGGKIKFIFHHFISSLYKKICNATFSLFSSETHPHFVLFVEQNYIKLGYKTFFPFFWAKVHKTIKHKNAINFRVLKWNF